MEVAIGKRKENEIYGNDYAETDDGTCVRDYIHVSDLAVAHILAMEYLINNRKSIAVNLGSEKGYSVAKMVEAVRLVISMSIQSKYVARRSGDRSICIASSKKALEVLGWKPKHTDLETIVSSMWEVYKPQDTHGNLRHNHPIQQQAIILSIWMADYSCLASVLANFLCKIDTVGEFVLEG